MEKKIKVEVAYVSETEQEVLSLFVDEDSSVGEVIKHSGILTRFPEIDLRINKVGIYSKFKNIKDFVKEGDRVEIYRALKIDPKDLRKLKAKNLCRKK